MKPRSGMRCGTSSRTSPTRKPNDSTSRGATTSLRRSVNRLRTRLRGGAGFGEADDDPFEAEEENAIRFCNRQWTCSCVSIRSFVTRTRDWLLRWARSIKAPATRWAAWRRRCPIATTTHEDYGLRVVQLKRALRGAAFARGALFPLRSAMSAEQFDELFRDASADGDRHCFRAGQGSIRAPGRRLVTDSRDGSLASVLS